MPKDNNPVFPMQTIGDEATAINTSWMFLMWTSQLSPYLTDAAASRMLIAIIPAERYVIHPESQINLTIQAACKCITESFNRLSEVGIPLSERSYRQQCCHPDEFGNPFFNNHYRL